LAHLMHEITKKFTSEEQWSSERSFLC
jgi:hypothetical protein